jgi:hypothetical protein
MIFPWELTLDKGRSRSNGKEGTGATDTSSEVDFKDCITNEMLER